MRLAELVLATVLLILFIVKLIKGQKYEEYTKQLKGDDYPLSELYTRSEDHTSELQSLDRIAVYRLVD